MHKKSYSLFSVYGIEIEYMIVDKESLTVMPIADQLLERLAGELTNEVELGDIAVSNELALHVIELKTNGPRASLSGLADSFYRVVKQLNTHLADWNAMLLPSGMHPTFNPNVDPVKLWPHGDQIIYQTYHAIFNCRGHGWGNLQSVHINLPFSSDEEFAKLHNAIRLVLAVIPALTASTPFCEGKPSGVADTRLQFYGKNQKRLPIISGDIIPEFIDSAENYQKHILEPMYQAIAPLDTDGVLQCEWLNSRGAIARFDRDAIEIRVVDSQESPVADLAVVEMIVGLLQQVVAEETAYLTNPIATAELKRQFDLCVTDGMSANFVNPDIIQQLGFSKDQISNCHQLWQAVAERMSDKVSIDVATAMQTIAHHGNLAQRLLRDETSLGIADVYQKLANCLAENAVYQ